MKMGRRVTWITLLLFCALVWGLIFAAFAYSAQPGKNKSGIPADKNSDNVPEKIRLLDLSDKQRKFIESLIENNKKD